MGSHAWDFETTSLDPRFRLVGKWTQIYGHRIKPVSYTGVSTKVDGTWVTYTFEDMEKLNKLKEKYKPIGSEVVYAIQQRST